MCVSAGFEMLTVGVFAFMVKTALPLYRDHCSRLSQKSGLHGSADMIKQCLSGLTEHFLLVQVQVPSALTIFVGFRLFKHSLWLVAC